MSYLTQSHIAQDNVLSRRIIACAAAEGIPDPQYWVGSMMWKFSARPGWVAAYRAATSPAGGDESAITDAMILHSVQELSVPPEPAPPAEAPDES